MPELDWNPDEVLECLAVFPEVEEYEVSHKYTVTDGVLTLVLTIWQLESVAEFVLSRTVTGEEVTRFCLVIRDGIRHRNEKFGEESLEFRDCIFAPREFYYLDIGDVFDRKLYPVGVNAELSVYPHITIRFAT